MTLDQLIAMLERRLANSSQLRSSADSLGDMDRVSALEAEMAETQATLDRLKTLL